MDRLRRALSAKRSNNTIDTPFMWHSITVPTKAISPSLCRKMIDDRTMNRVDELPYGYHVEVLCTEKYWWSLLEEFHWWQYWWRHLKVEKYGEISLDHISDDSKTKHSFILGSNIDGMALRTYLLKHDIEYERDLLWPDKFVDIICGERTWLEILRRFDTMAFRVAVRLLGKEYYESQQ